MADEITLTGQQLLDVSNAISALKRDFYGKGPKRTKSYVNGRHLFVVLDTNWTKVEETLLENGDEQTVRDVRTRFQEVMRHEFMTAVERITGQKCLDYMSQVLIKAGTVVEIFEFADPDDPSVHTPT